MSAPGREKCGLDQAEEMHEKSLAIAENLGRQQDVASESGNLGSVAKQRGDLARARKLWTKARDPFAKVCMPPEVKQVQDLLDALAKEPGP